MAHTGRLKEEQGPELEHQACKPGREHSPDPELESHGKDRHWEGQAYLPEGATGGGEGRSREARERWSRTGSESFREQSKQPHKADGQDLVTEEGRGGVAEVERDF